MARIALFREHPRGEIAGRQAQHVHLDAGLRLVERIKVDLDVVFLERRISGDLARLRGETE